VSDQTLREITGAIVASGATANLLLGTTLQTANRPSMLRVTATVPAAAASDARMDVFAGGRQLTGRAGQNVPTELAAGRGPDNQLGWLLERPVAAGELLELVFRNIDTVNAIAAPGVSWYATLD
jgi:hypothetical protein